MFAVAVLAAVAAVSLLGGWTRPYEGDGTYFARLGKALAAGEGYVLSSSPWPGDPHLGRLPLWPAVLAVPWFLFPHADLFVVLRGTAVAMHGLGAALMAVLTMRLFGQRRAAIVAGLLFGLSPSALSFIEGGMSESLWAVCVLSAAVLIARDALSPAAAALLGLSVLVRANFLLLPGAVAAVLAVRGRWQLVRHWRRAVVWMALFALAPLAWMLRNYGVTGSFPLLSGLEGETFYGANNARVASDLSVWGYWIFPDDIPGEEKKYTLGARMNEVEMNRYYGRRGREFLRAELPGLPRFLLGKLIRGFMPVPWVPNAASLAASVVRIAIFVAFFTMGRRYAAGELYRTLLWSVFLVVLATTLIYYGIYRFTWCFEIFLMPAVAMAVVAWADARRARRQERVLAAGD